MGAKAEARAPLIEHIRELRKRLLWSVLFIVAGACVGYTLHETLLQVIQQPLGETLYYTTPTGALSFIIKVCVVFGLFAALPVAMFHVFSFLAPLLKKHSKRVVVLGTLLSVILAITGASFAYFITLPAALKFLVGFGGVSNIQSLITANEYFNFAFAYILGFALLFQLPLIVGFINRIKPLTPKKVFSSARYVILFSYIGAAIITPTPDPINQSLMALPAILLYMISATVLLILNKYKRSPQKATSHQTDAKESIQPLKHVLPSKHSVLVPVHSRSRRTFIEPVYTRRPVDIPTQRSRNTQLPQQPRIISDFL